MDKDVEFLGWYEEPEYENKLDKIPSDYHEDLILYAKERQLRYYDYQDGKWKITNK